MADTVNVHTIPMTPVQLRFALECVGQLGATDGDAPPNPLHLDRLRILALAKKHLMPTHGTVEQLTEAARRCRNDVAAALLPQIHVPALPRRSDRWAIDATPILSPLRDHPLAETSLRQFLQCIGDGIILEEHCRCPDAPRTRETIRNAAQVHFDEAYGIGGDCVVGEPELQPDGGWLVPISVVPTFGVYRCGAFSYNADGKLLAEPGPGRVQELFEDQYAEGCHPAETPMRPSLGTLDIALTSGCAQLEQARGIALGKPGYERCTLRNAVQSFDTAIRIFRMHGSDLLPSEDLDALQRERDRVARRAEVVG